MFVFIDSFFISKMRRIFFSKTARFRTVKFNLNFFLRQVKQNYNHMVKQNWKKIIQIIKQKKNKYQSISLNTDIKNFFLIVFLLKMKITFKRSMVTTQRNFSCCKTTKLFNIFLKISSIFANQSQFLATYSIFVRNDEQPNTFQRWFCIAV